MWRLQRQPPDEKVCEDVEFHYYLMRMDAQVIMYRIDKWREHCGAQRQFYLSEPFARVLGFFTLRYMMKRLPHIQFWRGFITVKALKRHLDCLE